MDPALDAIFLYLREFFAKFLNLHALWQLLLSSAYFFISWSLASIIKKILKKDQFLEHSKKEKRKIIYGLILPMIWFVLQWITVFIYREYDALPFVLKPVASLLTAWIVIHIMASLVRQSFMFRLVSVSAWLIAALDITGVLDPLEKALEMVRLEIGTVHLTLFSLVQGGVAIIFLLWLAVTLSHFIEQKIKKDPRIEPSARVLFSKLIKISLFVVAIFWGLTIMGINMSVFAVVGGAIGVGLGFGLQKVVSNFICGLILLLDKSIKPGDVIAIENGTTYGFVNKLNARYVSVRTRSGKEHLIPNEDFVTQKVENWSFSDKMVRLKIKVGVGYDSDMHLVARLLEESTEDFDRVMQAPKPAVRLIDFGDSSVLFELRVWISDPEQGVYNVRSQILFRIWDLFKEHGITLPFNQTDLHIKSNDLEAFPVAIKK